MKYLNVVLCSPDITFLTSIARRLGYYDVRFKLCMNAADLQQLDAQNWDIMLLDLDKFDMLLEKLLVSIRRDFSHLVMVGVAFEVRDRHPELRMDAYLQKFPSLEELFSFAPPVITH